MLSRIFKCQTIVQTERPAKETPAPIGKAAFAAAREEIRSRAQSQKDDEPETETPESDKTTPAEAPPAQEPEPAAEPSETGPPEDTLLSPDEVSKLSAKDRKLYEKAQKVFTQKTQKIAAERKEYENFRKTFDEWKPLIDAFTNDPDSAIKQIAERRGLKFAPQDTPIPEQAKETVAQLPEEWQFLKPVFDTLAQRVREETLREVRGEIEPIRAAQDMAISNAVAAETKSTLEAFSAKYPGWQKLEPKMLELGAKFMPAEGAMTDFEYMETLYKLVNEPQTNADQTRRVIDKINKVVENSEPITNGTPEARVEHIMPNDVTPRNRLRKAAEAARQGIRWVARD